MGYRSPTTCFVVQNMVQAIQEVTTGDVFYAKKVPSYFSIEMYIAYIAGPTCQKR
jgi:hypothetical protein